jgi:methylthioribose-1-phosphate isomerase
MAIDQEALAIEVRRAVVNSVEKSREAIVTMVMRDLAAELAAYSMAIAPDGKPNNPLARMIVEEIEQELGETLCKQS